MTGNYSFFSFYSTAVASRAIKLSVEADVPRMLIRAGKRKRHDRGI